MSDLSGKTILITGASRGIGAATARVCAEDGAKLILHASVQSAASNALADEIGPACMQFLFVDLAEPGAGKTLVDQALATTGGQLNGVVNNAGIYLPSPLAPSKLPEWATAWQRTMAVNVQAPADIMRAMIEHFRQSGGGTIVNIASRAGHRGDGPDHAAYAASKGALLAMTKTWARGLAGEGIDLYAIAPGWVETRMAPEDIAARKKAVAEIPLGRVADAKEVGAMVAFLLSGQCRSAIGATIDINGASYVR